MAKCDKCGKAKYVDLVSLMLSHGLGEPERLWQGKVCNACLSQLVMMLSADTCGAKEKPDG